MPFENLQIRTPNFCLSPIDGSFCNVNNENPTTVLDVKNKGGALVSSFTFSFNIVGELKALEYLGPIRSYKFISGLEFVTLEWVTNAKALIKKWEVDLDHQQLNLKKTFLLQDTGLYHFDVNSMAPEIIRRRFKKDQEAGSNHIFIDDITGLTVNQKLFLGPSFDPDNLGEIEVVYIQAIDSFDNKLTLTSNISYDYIKTDSISFYKCFYVISNGGIGASTDKGTLFKLDSDTGSIIEVTNDGVYKRINVSRWCEEYNTLASLCNLNILYIDPQQGYKVVRSQIVDNYQSDKSTPYDIYDFCFDGTDIFKLSQIATFRTADGNLQQVNWTPYYNFKQDTLAPYTHNVTNYSDDNFTIGSYDTTTLRLTVRDQYNVSLRDVPVSVAIVTGDQGALLDPLSGEVTTDINGQASVIYRAGALYTGMTQLSYKATGGSSFTGSEFVWDRGYVRSYSNFPEISNSLFVRLFQDKEFKSINRTALQQISDMYKIPENPNSTHLVPPEISILCHNYFTTPGGNWVYSSSPETISNWLPELINYGPNDSLGPPDGKFSVWNHGILDFNSSLSDRITLVEDLVSSTSIWELNYFLVYQEMSKDDPDYVEHGKTHKMLPPFNRIEQQHEGNSMTFSQLKLSLHTNWVDGHPYDELFTNVRLDQFVFVEDAIPKFWSEKNPVDTNIWIRLRPFAHNLNADTVVMKVRELSYIGDTGYQDVSNVISKTYYDAGSGLLGVEILYDPPVDFHNRAFVYVYIELYDTAPYPNRIYVNYWFEIIPDFKGPFIENLLPAAGETNVSPDTFISFDLKDTGTGININTLDITVNSILVSPQQITKVNRNFYKVKYSPPTPFLYGEEVIIKVSCADNAEQANVLHTSYPFYIDDGFSVDFVVENPKKCSWGVPRFNDVEVLVLGEGGGVNKNSLRLQIYEKDVTKDPRTSILPVLYRLK